MKQLLLFILLFFLLLTMLSCTDPDIEAHYEIVFTEYFDNNNNNWELLENEDPDLGSNAIAAIAQGRLYLLAEYVSLNSGASASAHLIFPDSLSAIIISLLSLIGQYSSPLTTQL